MSEIATVAPPSTSKRLAVFLDGTTDKSESNTNVWRARSLCAAKGKDGLEQIIYYAAGALIPCPPPPLLPLSLLPPPLPPPPPLFPSPPPFLPPPRNAVGRDRPRGGFRLGIDNQVVDAYRMLVQNYEAGDEIFVFGFSRAPSPHAVYPAMCRDAASSGPARHSASSSSTTVTKRATTRRRLPASGA